jgi:hypothetical protein
MYVHCSNKRTVLNYSKLQPFHKTSWERLAWPSRRGLGSWFLDLLKRVDQLNRWSATLITPVSLVRPVIMIHY